MVENQNAGEDNANGGTEETLTTPPFATKEPERYQATRIETASDGAHSVSSQTFIARDGERRREDFETSVGVKISRLELPSGIYILRPDKKIYAELKPNADIGRSSSVPPDFSPDKLLNSARPEAHYEKLGTETVNGRATVKYRVTLRGKVGTEKEIVTESLVWVDESLGMPIKSEITSSTGERVTMELRDIKETVDAGLFELPPDYQKVEAERDFSQANPVSAVEKGRD